MAAFRRRNADPIDSGVRGFLIEEAFRFIDAICVISGIQNIVLIGSLTTGKPEPKDADLPVTVEDDLDLTALATELC